MATFWEKITAIFTAAEESSPSTPAVHETLERDEEAKADYRQWKKTIAPRRLLAAVNDQYANYLQTGQTNETVTFLDTPSSKGFAVHFNEMKYAEREIRHFFHFLAERIKSLDYRTQIKDRRIFNRKDWVETQERYYLKPRTRRPADSPPPGRGELGQKFGNITLELELRDYRPHNLRLRATTYQDSLYAEPLSFAALLMALGGTTD